MTPMSAIRAALWEGSHFHPPWFATVTAGEPLGGKPTVKLTLTYRYEDVPEVSLSSLIDHTQESRHFASAVRFAWAQMKLDLAALERDARKKAAAG